MACYHRRSYGRNSEQFDLFDWLRERELRQSSRAVRQIAFRFRISIHHAAAIATLAGIDSECAQ